MHRIRSDNFSKSKLDKYVLFNFDNWNDKHPHGVLQQTIGEVNDMSAFEEHQMNCKEINHSIQKFSKQAYKTLIQKKTSESKDVIDDMMAKYDILDRTNENVISIDPEGCTDIDDALSVKFDKESPWKTTISIYIAHVPIWFEYLDLWHLLDRRVSTVYLTSEKRTMLPTILSENLCSLKALECNRSHQRCSRDKFYPVHQWKFLALHAHRSSPKSEQQAYLQLSSLLYLPNF